MKKLLLSLLGVLMAFPALAYTGQEFSYEYEGNTLVYRVFDGNKCTVAGCHISTSGTVVIPAVAKNDNSDYSVVSISSEAFSFCSDITSIEIPNSITRIGGSAFSDCRALTSIELPNSITSIGEFAFFSCSALTSIKLPNSITSIAEGTFTCCFALTSIELPESITSIGDSAFGSCTAMTSIELPNSITSIGNSAFSCCTALTSIELPDSIISIGEAAFSECTALTSIELPNSLTSIGNSAFSACKALTSIELPDSLTSIGSEAFRECGLTRIKLPSSLKYLGSNAFSYNNIVSVKGGENIEEIGADAFRNCRVSRFNFGNNIKFIGDKAFGDEIKVLSFETTVPPTLESANMGYESDIAYNILVLVPVNGDDAYKNHKDWEGFYIAENTPGIATVQMSGQYSLAEEIRTQTGIMPGAVTQLAINGPLSDTDWMVINNNLLACHTLDLSGVTNTKIPDNAYQGNKHLLNITLPKDLVEIGNFAFSNCGNLRISSLPSGLTSIGNYAFSFCESLDLEKLPESLKSIGNNAFSYCVSLNLTSLPEVEYISEGAFEYCTRIMEIDLSKTQIRVLNRYCFKGCNKLRTVILPETLTEIKNEAFSNTSVNFVNFPKSLTDIGLFAFNNTPLIAADLSGSLAVVNSGAFQNCKNLTTVNLSTRTTFIGGYAFDACRSLNNISSPGTIPPTVETGAFSNVRTRDCVVAIPTLAFRDYLNAPGWGGFTQLSNLLSMPLTIEDENGNKMNPDDENSEDIQVSIVENGVYDETIKSVTSEEEQAAEDKVRDEEFFGDSSSQSKEEIENKVRRARKVARENTAVIEAKAKNAFMRLHSGSQMTIGDNKGYRVRIACKPGVEIAKVEFNGKDVTDEIIDDILILPTLKAASTLKITRKGTFDSVSSITGDSPARPSNIYNMQGILIKADASQSDIEALAPGLYIIAGKKVVIK